LAKPTTINQQQLKDKRKGASANTHLKQFEDVGNLNVGNLLGFDMTAKPQSIVRVSDNADTNDD
jgi:hypothetical protein